MTTSQNGDRPGDALDANEKLARAEKVRDACGVSFADAREALEACGYDVLDAVVWLERAGRAAPASASYSTTSASADEADAQAMSAAQSDYERSTRRTGVERALGRAWEWLKRVLRKGLDVSFVAERDGRKVISMPLLAFVVLVLLAFWIVVPLVAIGLFCGFRYHFEGLGSVTVDVNEWSRKASDGVEQLKHDMRDDKPADEPKE